MPRVDVSAFLHAVVVKEKYQVVIVQRKNEYKYILLILIVEHDNIFPNRGYAVITSCPCWALSDTVHRQYFSLIYSPTSTREQKRCTVCVYTAVYVLLITFL